MRNKRRFMVNGQQFKIFGYWYAKAIALTRKHFNKNTYGEIESQFGMTYVSLTNQTTGENVTIDNENFEIIIGEYIRRSKEIKQLNK